MRVKPPHGVGRHIWLGVDTRAMVWSDCVVFLAPVPAGDRHGTSKKAGYHEGTHNVA